MINSPVVSSVCDVVYCGERENRTIERQLLYEITCRRQTADILPDAQHPSSSLGPGPQTKNRNPIQAAIHEWTSLYEIPHLRQQVIRACAVRFSQKGRPPSPGSFSVSQDRTKCSRTPCHSLGGYAAWRHSLAYPRPLRGWDPLRWRHY